MQPALMRFTGFVLLACLALAVAAHPSGPLIPGAMLLAYLCLLQLRPAAWLVVVPALLPVLDLSPWTGNFHFGEFELVLLATAASGYIALADKPSQLVLARPVLFAASAYGLVFLVAAMVGLLPIRLPDLNAFATYSSRFNALRVFSGFGWAVLLLPLLARTGDVRQVGRLFTIGMVSGVALASAAVTWERAAFPGLLDFASDYRATGTFFAMHTGGAALDAYLALAFPFAALWLLRARSVPAQAMAMAVTLLALYASFAIFSRDMYLAYGGAAVVAGGVKAWGLARAGRMRAAPMLGGAAAIVLLAAGLAAVFGASGYRGLAAALALLVAAAALAATPVRPAAPVPALAGVLAAVLLSVALDKGAYIAVAASTATFAAGLPLMLGRHGKAGANLAVAAFAGLAAGAVAVAAHWGGQAAVGPSAAVAALAIAMVAVGWLRPASGSLRLATALRAGAIAAIVLGILVPASASYYLGTRFATTQSDLAARARHWDGAVSMMDGDTWTRVFGMGLGRYPDTYAWRNRKGEMPGTLGYVEEGGRNVFLRLGVPHYETGYGESLRVLQHVAAPPGGRYLFSADLRRSGVGALPQVAVCERWLLYPQNCAAVPLRLGKAAGTAWQRYEAALPVLPARDGSTFLRPPTQLEISVAGQAGWIDIDNVSLVDLASGAELVANGSFARTQSRWFFSSDRSHLPWHVKNFAVNAFFETGWAGLATIVLLLACAAVAIARRALAGSSSALAQLAGLVGFLLVGLFDSLFDVPRLTLAFFLLLAVACAVPATPRRPPTARPAGSAAAPP